MRGEERRTRGTGWTGGGWGRAKSKGDAEHTRRKGTGNRKLWQIKGDGRGAKIVSVCVVIKRFMGAEEEGGGLQPLFLLYSLNLGCVDRLGVGAG